MIPYKYSIIILIVICNMILHAQSYRGMNNDGVDLYNNKKYADAEVNFKKAIEKDKDKFESNFNLGDAIYKQGRYDESSKYFLEAFQKTKDTDLKAKSLYNLGNSLLKGNKIQESINAYKNSLKLNPNDKEAKYNLSYALNMLKQNQDKNKNQNKDKDKQQNQDKQKDQNGNDKNKDQQQNQQQNQQQKVKKEEAQRILDALKKNQKDLQKELRKVKAKSVYTEKDW